MRAFDERLLEAVAAQPGVMSAAITINHPLDGGFTNSFVLEVSPLDPLT